MLALTLDENKVLGLAGVGPKAIQNIQEQISATEFPELAAETPAEVTTEGAPGAEAGATAEPLPETTVVAEGAPAEAAEALVAEAVPGVEQAEKVHAARGKEGEEEVEPENAKDGVSLDELFKMKPEIFRSTTTEEEEAEKKKGKKQKKKGVELVLDEDLGAVVGRKKHKRGEGEFGEEE